MKIQTTSRVSYRLR